ncbi:MAG: hypothetical protein Q9226_009064, partial [Calogaya cf. arnoldii]
SNRNLNRALLLRAGSADELAQKLILFEHYDKDLSTTAVPKSSRPVILSFGGQTSNYVGLDPQVYANVEILQRHLDHCDLLCQSIAAVSIYPSIFQKEPIDDPVELQTGLFAVQYASARSWIDCGIEPAAVIGHSFGELTALCVSGVLSLKDALRMIIGRSTAVRDLWGPDRGAMLAVEGDLDQVERLLEESNTSRDGSSANIACFNGPRSFTLAGPVRSIETVVQTITSNTSYSSMPSKRLNVTHAYHSTLVEPLLTELDRVGGNILYNEPKIHLERATEFGSLTSVLQSS